MPPMLSLRRCQALIFAISLSIFGLGFVLFTLCSDCCSWKLVKYSTTDSIPQIEPGDPIRGYEHAAVASDTQICSKIAGHILSIGGTAVDAAVASLICNGVVNSQTSGLGGGFFMTVYDEHLCKATVLNARETAPAAAQVDMFTNQRASLKGPRASGIPGEIRGFWEARRVYGNQSLTWHDIIEPSIELCLSGIEVSKVHAQVLNWRAHRIREDPGMRAVFFNEEKNRTWVEGEVYYRPDLANTLRILAEKGEDAFYNGQLGKQLVQEIKEQGGLITIDDLRSYRAQWMSPISMDISDGESTLFSTPAPASGAAVAGVLQIMAQFTHSSESQFFHHRLIESFKHAFGMRTGIGDPRNHPEAEEDINNAMKQLLDDTWAKAAASKINSGYTFNESSFYGGQYDVVDDHGTAPVVVADGKGLAVAAISSLNLYFGCSFMSPSTGIILNNQMDDFSYPSFVNNFKQHPSPSNRMRPGKAPLSSMAPSVVVDKMTGKVKLLIAASGGTKIITSIAQTLVRYLYLHEDLSRAIDGRRVHHQLQPNEIKYEPGVSQDVISFLLSRGHEVRQGQPGLREAFVVGLRIDQKDRKLYPVADERKQGGVAGY